MILRLILITAGRLDVRRYPHRYLKIVGARTGVHPFAATWPESKGQNLLRAGDEP